MGNGIAPETDAWLRDGGLIVTASERAARAIRTAYHHARRAEGLTAWPAPKVHAWDEFTRRAWHEHTSQPRLPLSPAQEQALWAEIVALDGKRAPLLERPRHRVARMAMEAHKLLCLYAPQLLRPAARTSWQQDAGVFSDWLTAFVQACNRDHLISASSVPLDLIESLGKDAGKRAPLLLAGFDSILPTQRTLFDAWGEWREIHLSVGTEPISFYQTTDENTELAACALWCRHRLTADPSARLLVITQDSASRRGEIERSFLHFAGADAAASSATRLFEFSLGVPLKNTALARGALLTLRWLGGTIEEHEMDWLLSTGQTAARKQESRALTTFVRALRRRGWERTRWRLADFGLERPGELLPPSWIERMTAAAERLKEVAHIPTTPIEWAGLVPQFLDAAGWPGERSMTSEEFQQLRRWQQVLDESASLGFDGRRIGWKDFLNTIERTMQETLFAPESQDAPILIAGPAESAGLTADAVWFLGASEDAWPVSGSAHPLLPLEVQRNAGMPHAAAQLDWDLAERMTNRLLASAPVVHFSYARQKEGVEIRPSRLIVKASGVPENLPPELIAPPEPDAQTVLFEDHSQIPFPGGEIAGGATVLTAQSQCPFQAFAVARLGAQAWERAEPGLTPAQRGQLLHAVLHSIWSGPPGGIGSHAELIGLADIGAFVEQHVRTIVGEKMPIGARENMPRRYLELEEHRLAALVSEWLRFETTRIPFLVEDTEVSRNKAIAGLTLRLRLDRLDRLGDGTLLVIDYKTGDVSQKSWEMPRPEDVQLPLYASFALDPETEQPGGLVFAKIRAGELCFAGRVFDAKGLLMPNASARSDLVKRPLSGKDLEDWRVYIEKMVRDFLAGRALVEPREYPKTCERCGLDSLCRIQEHRAQLENEQDKNEEALDA